MASPSTSATQEVLNTTELLELILGFADARTVLIGARSVSYFFKNAISGPISLRKHLFWQISDDSPLIPAWLSTPLSEELEACTYAWTYCDQESVTQNNMEGFTSDGVGQDTHNITVYSPTSALPIFSQDGVEHDMLVHDNGQFRANFWPLVTIRSVRTLRLNPYLVDEWFLDRSECGANYPPDEQTRIKFPVNNVRFDNRRTAYSWPELHKPVWRDQPVSRPPVMSITGCFSVWQTPYQPRAQFQPPDVAWPFAAGRVHWERGYEIPDKYELVHGALISEQWGMSDHGIWPSLEVCRVYRRIKNASGVTFGDIHDAMVPLAMRKAVQAHLRPDDERSMDTRDQWSDLRRRYGPLRFRLEEIWI